MFRLSITSAAAELIHKALNATSVRDPVIYLIEVGEEITVGPDLAKAIIDGADDSVIRKISEHSIGNDLLKGRRRLVPAVYPRRQFFRWQLYKIDGVVFFIPRDLSKILSGRTLDVGQRGLVLRAANGTIVMPQCEL